MTTSNPCEPCRGVDRSLGDPLMQTALRSVRLVRVDIDLFKEDFDQIKMPRRLYPGFFLLSPDLPAGRDQRRRVGRRHRAQHRARAGGVRAGPVHDPPAAVEPAARLGHAAAAAGCARGDEPRAPNRVSSGCEALRPARPLRPLRRVQRLGGLQRRLRQRRRRTEGGARRVRRGRHRGRAGAAPRGEGCRRRMTRLERTPFGQTFEFTTAKRAVDVRCERALVFAGEYSCKLGDRRRRRPSGPPAARRRYPRWKLRYGGRP